MTIKQQPSPQVVDFETDVGDAAQIQEGQQTAGNNSPAVFETGADTDLQIDDTKDDTEVPPESKHEIGGRDGPDPTRYGDWEKNGRCIDF